MRKRGEVFLRGTDTPMHTMVYQTRLYKSFEYGTLVFKNCTLSEAIITRYAGSLRKTKTY